MPVSKRDKKVSLTKTQKKGIAMKQQLVEDIRKFLDKYDNLFVFTINNMRNGPLKDLREEWKDSRFFFAKRKVMAIALGRTEAEEIHKNIHKLASHLIGQCGLLFTNRPKDAVVQWFRDFSQVEFAKSGFVATETVTLPAGPLPDFSFSLEPHLRSLGLPTQLAKGKIILREDYTICTQGAKLTPEQASILKLIGKQMAEFKVKIICMWSKDGSFERFKVPKEPKPIAMEVDNESHKKSKKNKKASSVENKTEEEITQLFDQQSISESVNIEREDQMKSEEMEETTVIKPPKKTSKKIKETETEERSINETLENHPKSDEIEEIVTKSTKKRSKKSAESEVHDKKIGKDSEELPKSEEMEESETAASSKKKCPLQTKEITKKESKNESEEVPPNEKEEYDEDLKQSNQSPKITKENPRRSMRTPKPIRRSPDDKYQSVKKLTGSSTKTKSALKEKVTKSLRSTPRKSVSKKIFEEPEDVEMGE